MSDTIAAAPSAPRRSLRGTLSQIWVQVLLAMVIGALLGHFWPDLGARAQPLGDAFIKAIRVMIAPIIFCSVVHGVASMADMARVGRVTVKALVYFEIVTTIALAFSLVAVNLWKPGVGMNIDLSHVDTSMVKSYVAQGHARDTATFLLQIIPNSFVGAFTEGNVLQVLFVALLSGFGLVQLGERGAGVLALVDQIQKMFFKIVGIVMLAAPIGAFGAIAFTVGKFGAGSLLSLGQLVVGFWIVCIAFVALVLGPIAKIAGFSLLKLIRYIWEELLIVLATTSSETVLPRLIDKMKRAGCDEGVVGLVVPAGYSFNLDGTCLYLATAAVFLAQATNTPLDLAQQIGLLLVLLVTSKGAAGIAGAAFVVLAATIGSAGSIPVESVAILLGIHRLMSEGLTPTNLIGNAVATIVVARWENALDRDALNAALDA